MAGSVDWSPGRRGLIAGVVAIAGVAGLGWFVASRREARDRVPDDPYRPVYHFAPEEGWMNDPNGLVYHDDEYHLFYQAGEEQRRWDHASADDLVHWAEHGTQLPVEDGIQQYSGGGVVDENGDAGFGAGALVVTYTGHHEDGVEDQRLAYSTDGGRSFTKYAGNPIIDSDVGDFRDPNPVRYGDEWRLVVSRVASTDDRSAGVEVYSSGDLREWTYESTFEVTEGAGASAWECPDLFELPVEGTGERRWCLLVSAEWEAQELYVGDFDGTEFVADDRVVVDHGHDFYAGMTWANDPGPGRLLTGWLNNWNYAMDLPDPGWRGVQAFPRRLSLAETDGGVELRQRPADALSAVRGRQLASLRNERLAPGDEPLEGVEGRALVIDAEIAPGDADRVGVRVRESAEEATVVTYDTGFERLVVDRSDASAVFDSGPYAQSSAPLELAEGTVDLRLLVDRSTVELFAADGGVALSHLVYPDPESTGVSLFAEGGTATIRQFSAYEATLDRTD